MELFNAIFETFWTFAGSVILLSVAGTFTAACFCGIGKFAIVKIIKHYNKAGK